VLRDASQGSSCAATDEPRIANHESLSAWWQSTASTHDPRTTAALEAWRSAGFLGSPFPLLPQVSCRMTATSGAAHDLIRANLHRAPMYSGQIESRGPRYCPSIEDKVVRFAQRESHGVFLEPESWSSDWVYCNGISTSLPPDVQDAIVRSMPGCENAHIHRYGYAVEYDMVRPHQINVTGETKRVANFFLAGQINGTSGYEEAAAQGLVAGVNAARRARGEPEWTLGRDQAYIGVLMDDLVTKTPVEPYRMFTSRAEHRLLLRADNAPDRLTPIAIGRAREDAFARRQQQSVALSILVDRSTIDNRPLELLLRGNTFDVPDFERTLAALHAPRFDPAVIRTVHAERRYAAYIVRQRAEVRRHAEMEHRRLPDDFDYLAVHHLRAEARQALHRFRPRTFGEAARLEGITPADITLLAVVTNKRR
jgi:tRNA uridine 5-carboxymethylaminomethyl modification enzyme